jgi:hypothetical protein
LRISDQWTAADAQERGTKARGISWAAPNTKARSAAAWPDGNDDVNGPSWRSADPRGWRRPIAALMGRCTAAADR